MFIVTSAIRNEKLEPFFPASGCSRPAFHVPVSRVPRSTAVLAVYLIERYCCSRAAAAAAGEAPAIAQAEPAGSLWLAFARCPCVWARLGRAKGAPHGFCLKIGRCHPANARGETKTCRVGLQREPIAGSMVRGLLEAVRFSKLRNLKRDFYGNAERVQRVCLEGQHD